MSILTADDFEILASALTAQLTGQDVAGAVARSVPHLTDVERGLRVEDLYECQLLEAHARQAADGRYVFCMPTKVTVAGRLAVDAYKAPSR